MRNNTFVCYNLKVPREIWEEFRKTLSKDDIINNSVILLIEEKIKKHKCGLK